MALAVTGLRATVVNGGILSSTFLTPILLSSHCQGIMHALETIGLAVLVFATTNVDDFFLLLALFADGRSRKGPIVLGQYF